MSGKQLIHGRFDAQGVLSRDGFGEVLAAVDQKTNKSVSLRVLSNGEVGALVRRQVKALGTFQHPNVARSYGVVTADSGTSYLVQSPVSGQHVADQIASHKQAGKPLSLGAAFNIVSHVCGGLMAVLQSGPYGALRPSSVWILADGRVQIADLALARAALAAAGPGAFSTEDQAYLSAEVKSGAPPTAATDVYGAGLLFYFLLTGRSPNEAFVAPSQVHPEVTPAIEAEIYRALAPDPTGRHSHAEAFRSAIAAQLSPADRRHGEHPSIEIEVSLHSVRPQRAHMSIEVEFEPDAFGDNRVSAPGAAPTHDSGHPFAAHPAPEASPQPPINAAVAPAVGARVSLNQEFRASQGLDPAAAAAARERRSLGEVDLKGVLAKITEDDSPRWMVVKNGMDHGPFSGRQLVNAIVQGEVHPDHELMNTDTGKRGKVSEFAEFKEFLAQVEIRKFEADRAQKLVAADVKEKYGALFKMAMGGVVLLCLGLGFGYYFYTRSHARHAGAGDDGLDMYRRGDVEITGSAGILPIPKPGSRRSSSGGGGGGGGGGLSYEDAMMQAVELGSIGGGGEQQLSAGTVAGVMNKHLNQLYGACVRGKVGNVKIDMAIAGSGQVVGVSVGAGDASFQRCVAEQVRRIRFPQFGAPRMGARYSFGN